MATFVTNTPRPVSFGLRTLVTRLQTWLEARATRRALSALSARQLEDIGLTRGDIARIWS